MMNKIKRMGTGTAIIAAIVAVVGANAIGGSVIRPAYTSHKVMQAVGDHMIYTIETDPSLSEVAVVPKSLVLETMDARLVVEGCEGGRGVFSAIVQNPITYSLYAQPLGVWKKNGPTTIDALATAVCWSGVS